MAEREGMAEMDRVHLACLGCGKAMMITVQEYLCGGGAYCSECFAKALTKEDK